MKVKDLIKNKDYDYISYRLKMPKDKEKYYGNSIFIGYAASKDGKLISMDGDIYEEVCNKLKGRDIGIKIS